MTFQKLPLSFLAMLGTVNAAHAQSTADWQESLTAGGAQFGIVACSADGSTMVAGGLNTVTPIYISTNGGAAWTTTSLTTTLSGGDGLGGGHDIAVSADGSSIATTEIHQINVSHDGGATWVARGVITGPGYLGVASSADGARLAAVTFGGQIRTSSDAGTNWAAQGPALNWVDIVTSSNGMKLVAAVGYSQIYTSTDAGTNWTARATAQNWTCLGSSADGSTLVAVDQDDARSYSGSGTINISTNSGTNWQMLTSFPARVAEWNSVAISADGQVIAAGIDDYGLGQNIAVIYVVTNGGASWHMAYAPEQDWTSIALSANGATMIAAGYVSDETSPTASGIYTHIAPPTNAPALAVVNGGGTAVLSWPWPSAGFVLQQNSNMVPANWAAVTNRPAVVNQVIAPATNAYNFYRLISP